MENSKRSIATLPWVKNKAKKFIPSVILLSLLTAVNSVGFVFLALVSQRIIDISTGAMQGNVVPWIIILFGVIVLQVAANFLASYVRVRSSTKFEMSLRASLLDSFIGKKYGSVYRMHSGEVLNLFTSDIEVVVNGVIGIIPQSVSIVTKVAAGLIALIVIDPSFALIIAVLGVVLAVCGRFYSTHYKKLHKEVQNTNGVVRGFLQECIENIVVIKSFSTREPVAARLGELMRENYRKRIRRNNVSNVASAGLSCFLTAVITSPLFGELFR